LLLITELFVEPGQIMSFIQNYVLVVEELDETLFWLELLLDLETLHPNEIREIENEVKELLSMLATSKKSMKLRLNTP